MSGDDLGRALYLALLLAAVLGGVLINGRARLGHVAAQAAVWGLIFLGAVAVYGLWDDISATLRPGRAEVLQDGRYAIPLGRDGHYHVLARINGTTIEMLVDTGATGIVLTQEDAARIGLAPEDLAFLGRAMTANGSVATAPVRLQSLTIGSFTEENVRADVTGGEMETSLLGMSWLAGMSHVEITGGEMILTR